MVRAQDRFAAAAAPYVRVRITDMRDVDLATVRFDFDLTMALVLMHPDGTVYHRFGTRPADDPTGWSSIDALVMLLESSLQDHRAYDAEPTPPPKVTPRPAIELPPLQRRLAAGQRIDCVHCHTVNDAEHRLAVEQGRWRDDDRWQHPDPQRIGLRLDPVDQELVRAVAPESPAHAAGLAAGDRLRRAGVQPRVRTIADLQWALHQLPADATELPLSFVRGDAEQTVTLRLPAGWKQCSAAEYAWRPYKWNLSPSPGFGGPMLTPPQLQQLGLEADRFAFRVQYIVDQGERAASGTAAKRAGIKKGDVVLAFAGRSDFASVPHFQAFVRLELHVGQEVEVELLREGQRRRVRYALPE